VPHSILIADDSPLIRQSLRRWLEFNHWQVCGEASDGLDAIEKAKELKPDLIVLDLSMPGMNGLEAARELKRINPSIPLLMFTSFNTPNVKCEAIAAGCGAVVSKSDPQQLLVESLQRLLKSTS